jgi:hypothetical protein
MLHEQGILGSEPIPSWVGLPASAWDEPLRAEVGVTDAGYDWDRRHFALRKQSLTELRKKGCVFGNSVYSGIPCIPRKATIDLLSWHLNARALSPEGEVADRPGGRERTEQEYDTLIAKAGFRLTRVAPTESPVAHHVHSGSLLAPYSS